MNKNEALPKNEIKETGCCPIFNTEAWEEKEFEWKNKKFLKDHVNSVFHIPLNFGKVTTRNFRKIEDSHQKVLDDLVLSDEKSLWGSDIFFSVENDIPESEMVKVSGIFITKVFDGPYNHIGKWTKEMNAYLKENGKHSDKMYYWYTTCPVCAKAYGHNYVVLFAKVD